MTIFAHENGNLWGFRKKAWKKARSIKANSMKYTIKIGGIWQCNERIYYSGEFILYWWWYNSAMKANVQKRFRFIAISYFNVLLQLFKTYFCLLQNNWLFSTLGSRNLQDHFNLIQHLNNKSIMYHFFIILFYISIFRGFLMSVINFSVFFAVKNFD